jgi:inner membrane transporter RhtA
MGAAVLVDGTRGAGALRRLRVPLPRGAGVSRRLAGPASILAASASLQASAALATTLFATVGAPGTGALRFLAGSAVLLAVTRPRLRGRDRRAWVTIAAFGASMAAANVCIFQALTELPLGTVMTLQFLGPLTLALAASRRRLDLACALAAAGGVALLTGGPSGVSVVGAAFALGAAASVAASILAGAAVGRQTQGFDGLALSITAAALLMAPLSVGAASDGLDAGQLAAVSAVGILGIAAPHALFLSALRAVGAKLYSVLLSLDPAVALLAGLLLLGQRPSSANVAGILLVVSASAVAVGTRRA